jgi:hypothetical protein
MLVCAVFGSNEMCGLGSEQEMALAELGIQQYFCFSSREENS